MKCAIDVKDTPAGLSRYIMLEGLILGLLPVSTLRNAP